MPPHPVLSPGNSPKASLTNSGRLFQQGNQTVWDNARLARRVLLHSLRCRNPNIGGPYNFPPTREATTNDGETGTNVRLSAFRGGTPDKHLAKLAEWGGACSQKVSPRVAEDCPLPVLQMRKALAWSCRQKFAVLPTKFHAPPLPPCAILKESPLHIPSCPT
ncbi:hypothetical protein Bbelb_046630 [Branchiostoma belcheri]|nr:hypothetical protein Bbelb_046630 [Branchiostoma belcheri]